MRRLIEAKQVLPHGDFGAMIESDLPFGEATARKLMAIADDRRLSNRSQWNVLPPTWTTLYELTKLPDDEFEDRIRRGGILFRPEK